MKKLKAKEIEDLVIALILGKALFEFSIRLNLIITYRGFTYGEIESIVYSNYLQFK